ncbi:MAG: type VI secretion system protein ImpL [Gammaproteobacteria bacterium]|nr:type VI secretion system protein ImpL [Gammaproteobacteria bacterium]MBU1489818.1 type VI secretion system protein ImpL [Gammaproteobacteria bacterium]MBU2067737.1 type VI secretion system protein ImpL [Gammaproteobacteria bacterium]MBU2140920.1 type VI secretion system protein ImpL [Gammaproteobacteria bacterium]MBU2218408.1 type VI secretion system protein ImpL [Gammaproteobacteria bacterium]
MSGLAIILSVLGIVLLLLALGVLFWWLRTQSGTAMRSFYAAVRKMEHEQGLESRYQTPWLMLVGDPREGSQLCAEWQLNPVGRPSWFGRWWADQDGALLVVPQTLFLPEEGSTAATFVWRRLLGMLIRLRGQRPLDGVIWVIPLSRLEDDAQGMADAIVLRRRFTELLQHLGLSLPVHVLITGLEDLPGIQELLAALPETGRDQALGWSSPYGLDAGWQGYWLDDAVDQVAQALQVAIMEVGAVKGELAEELYRLPDRVHGLKGNIRALLEPVFQGNAQGEAPVLRGLYFSAEQVSAKDSQAWALSPQDSSPGHGIFSRHLWRQRFLVEQGLAKAVPRILRLRQRWQKLMAGMALAIGTLWLVAMLWVWQEGQRDARELTRLLQVTHSGHAQFTNPERSQEQARRNLQGFWSLLAQAPRWHFSSLVYPTSWLSSLDGQMDYLLRTTARNEAMRPLLQMQRAELDTLLAIRSSSRRADVEGEQPNEWPNYVKAHSIALGVSSLEQQNHLLAEALNGDKGVLEPLAQLGNSALGLGLDTASLAHRSYYDSALRGLAVPGLQALDLEAYREPLSEQFQTLMKLWLTQYFLAGNFVRPAGYLKVHLANLKNEQGSSLKELEEINSLVGNLEDLIVLTNAAWSHSSGEELVPGYRNMMDNVRQSSLLGPTVEASLNSEALNLRKRFHSQWIESVGSRDNLLQRQAGGSLTLQEHVSDLDRNIKGLLQRDFVVVALRNEGAALSPQGLGNVDELALVQALNYQQSYRDFVTQELAQIPPDYRGGMLKAAGQAVVLAIWSGLSSATERRNAAAGRNFDVSATQARQVMQALHELNRADLAGALQMQLTRRAVTDVNAALATIDALPVFGQRFDIAQWDGGPNLGLQLFRASDVQDLKTSLAQQYEVIASSSEEVAPALDWLRAQTDLPLVVQDKLIRLSSIAEEMLKYKAQNPTSTPALFEQLISRDFVEMDLSTCRQVLSTANVPNGAGDLALRGRNLREQAEFRCNQLLTQGAAAAWNDLADYFNQYLANRFPFAYSLEATDADPARVQYFLELIDSRLAQAEQGLKWATPGDQPAAEDFLTRLKQARNWLGPLFVRDESGILGVELDVRWRTDREDERGADQVIAWSLHAADRQIAHPGEAGQRLHWNVGDPLQVMLRWARDSEQRPSIDPLQPSMAVSELEAGWEYRGPWALMRLLRSHIVMQRQPSMDYTEFPLTLQVPVRGSWDGSPEARMFMRLSLLSQGSKLPLSIPPLPVMAPRSPFTSSHSASLVGTEVMQ